MIGEELVDEPVMPGIMGIMGVMGLVQGIP
jgi:hypothetical protein